MLPIEPFIFVGKKNRGPASFNHNSNIHPDKSWQSSFTFISTAKFESNFGKKQTSFSSPSRPRQSWAAGLNHLYTMDHIYEQLLLNVVKCLISGALLALLDWLLARIRLTAAKMVSNVYIYTCVHLRTNKMRLRFGQSSIITSSTHLSTMTHILCSIVNIFTHKSLLATSLSIQ